MGERTWRGKPLGHADTADLRRNLPDLPAGDYEAVRDELLRRDTFGERWFDQVVSRLDADQKTGLRHIWDNNGTVMAHTEGMAMILASLGGRVRALPTDLVHERRGGSADPNFTGQGIFDITPLGRVVAERLFGSPSQKTGQPDE